MFDDAIDGVTINAAEGAEGEEVALDVAFDKASVQTRIQNFVTEYNAMQAQLAKLGSYDAETQNGRPAAGRLAAALDRNRNATWAQRAGERHRAATYTTLASLGITTNATGALAIDTQAHQGSGRRSRKALRNCSARRTALRLGCPSVR